MSIVAISSRQGGDDRNSRSMKKGRAQAPSICDANNWSDEGRGAWRERRWVRVFELLQSSGSSQRLLDVMAAFQSNAQVDAAQDV